MVLDYSERRPVSKNRPRKQPLGFFVFVLAGAVVVSFGSGLMVGWLCFKPAAPKQGGGNPVNAPAVQKANRESVPAAGLQPTRQDVPLTFYQTLPHGGKAVIGSGLNPQKYEVNGAKKPASQMPPPGQNAVPPVAAQPEDHPVRVSAPNNAPKHPDVGADHGNDIKNQSSSKSTYCVQVVSARDKKDAEAVKARLTARGLGAYVIESKLPDRGVWYRVRLGRHLEQSEAKDLAAKAGKSAIVVQE